MYRIMIVEDDVPLREQLSQILQGYGYSVCVIQDFHKVEEQFEKESPHLVVLDINLPYYDGNYYCKIFRRSSKVPIIITSARNSEMNQILSIELGADDYLVKPFAVELFIAKVNAWIRRTYGDYAAETKGKEEDNQLAVGDLTLDEKGFKLIGKSKTMELSKNEFKLMKVFFQRKREVLTREELLEALWDQSDFVDDNTLTVNITRLRGKLADLGYEGIIKTKRGVGYVFDLD
ncbi:response regulator transcription factor [Anaerosporobacter faecicola]|uniref:response regulator transcription factor n=1 Tax=Anaerosporobacter faecicola TaxID=2718714 RepID=UPI0014390F85|nr:response regulator transcription factor [Anaerosporobacter faecicola]